MTKPLLNFSLLLFTFTFNACVQKNTYIGNDQPIIPIAQSTPVGAPVLIENHMPISTPTPAPISTPSQVITEEPIRMEIPAEEPVLIQNQPAKVSEIAPSTSGDMHQLQTVQGPVLAVEERSNGFVFPQYQDKIILLDIFGKDCPYCFEEMPIINSLKQKYAGNLQVIALQAENPMSRQEALGLIQEHQMNYPVIDKEDARDLLYFIQTNYEWTGILPYMLIIKNGVTEFPFSGPTSYQELDEAISSLL